MSGMTIMDYINLAMKAEAGDVITREEFTKIRNCGSEEELREAVERMEMAGGYDNLV